ncbi:MAG: Coenzyme F420 hydrogenase/dehydrogenase, beta subunit C-terminal domain [Oscillospiraceae bacterium]|nr:Coenzyme F420 hydrogenase/dehydrogenase, beta subunit C-terminal domain [Oscillospiraceae bacterium]
MNNIGVFQRCSNCGACYNLCPVNAISVKEDELFYRPIVDTEKCLNCGRCQTVCPVNAPQYKQKPVRAYAAIHDDERIVRSSSSGGVFRALADRTLEAGGIVYGAAYADGVQKVVMTSSEQVPLDQLQKSKYVESLVGLSFRDVKEQLEGGKSVLYCGAPCQIAGLKRFLGKEYDKLLTCDFSCGGMPSHKMYRQWLDWLAAKLKAPVAGVDFRPKTFGWRSHAVNVRGENGRTYVRLRGEDAYFYCFVEKHISVRDYCLECEFANNHYADIILADFWKHRSISKVANGDKGISLLIANSEKGERAVSAIAGQVALTTLDLESATYNLREKQIKEGFKEARSAFLEDCRSKGFILAAGPRKYNWKFRLKYRIKTLLGRN